jgi:hypothetical protein
MAWDAHTDSVSQAVFCVVDSNSFGDRVMSMKKSYSLGVYEKLGAEWCDEIAAEFEREYKTDGRRVMQKQTEQGQVSGLVKQGELHVWHESDSSVD